MAPPGSFRRDRRLGRRARRGRLRDLRDSGGRSPAARAALRRPRRPRVALRPDLRRRGADPRAGPGHHAARQAACRRSRFQGCGRRRRLSGGGAPGRAGSPAAGRAGEAGAARHPGREPLPAPAQRVEGQGGGFPGRARGGRRRAGRRVRDAVRHSAGAARPQRRVRHQAEPARGLPPERHADQAERGRPRRSRREGHRLEPGPHGKGIPPVELVAGQALDRNATYRGASFRISERAVAGTPWRMVVTVPSKALYAPLSTTGGGSRGPGS